EGVAAANLLWQEYTVYGVEGGSPTGFGGRRYWRSCSNRTNGNWGPWREVARASEAMTHTFLTAATDANTLIADNTWYSWTASAAIGANFPAFTSNWAAAGYMRVAYAAATQISQEVTFLITGQKPRTFFRFGNSSTGVWQPWKATSSWHAATGLPSSDMGDIYVDGEGWYAWNGTAYRLTRAGKDHGQCRLEFVSNQQIKLIQWNGDGLIINGRQYRIPAAGVTLANTGLAINTLYYVYARDNGSGDIALECQTVAAAPRATHSDGVEIKSGDPTRTLVGMVLINGVGWFVSGTIYRHVISWFNRRNDVIWETGTPNTTAATSYVKLTSGLYTLLWARVGVRPMAVGITRGESAGQSAAYAVMTVEGTA
ncbi:MAG: pyocin knob domain-containing protein, partial [Stenotrophomonas sp.]